MYCVSFPAGSKSLRETTPLPQDQSFAQNAFAFFAICVSRVLGPVERGKGKLCSIAVAVGMPVFHPTQSPGAPRSLGNAKTRRTGYHCSGQSPARLPQMSPARDGFL